MKVAFVQFDIAWEAAAINRSKIDEIISSDTQDVDLLVLPEMFSTGFSMDTRDIFEHADGQTVQWMKSNSARLNCVITGSLIIEEEGKFYNRLFWVRPDGSMDYYDKKHLFTLAKEDHHFTAGEKRKIFNIEAGGETWRICPLICYDLRFPVWSRNTEHYDVLLYVANFPEKRRHAWSSLLIARAIENQCFTVGVNRIGTDGIGIPYSGDSVVLDYAGRELKNAGSEEGVFYVNFSKEKQLAYRRAYNFLGDRDEFVLS